MVGLMSVKVVVDRTTCTPESNSEVHEEKKEDVKEEKEREGEVMWKGLG